MNKKKLVLITWETFNKNSQEEIFSSDIIK
jgi:hypothetical protein